VVALQADKPDMGATQLHCPRTARAAPYVLGQLDARSRLAFDRHMRVCARCRDEVELLMSAADAVPLLSAQAQAPEPSDPDQRYSPAILALAHASAVADAKSAAAEAKRAPAQPQAPGDGRPSLQAIPGGRDVVELRKAAHAQRLETAALRSGFKPSAARLIARRGGATGRPLRQRRTSRRFLRRPVPGPAMVGFVAVAIIAIVTVALSSREAGIRYARVKAGWTAGGAAIEVEGNQLGLVVEHMPRPSRGTGYQVWVVERKTRKLVPTSAWLHLDKAGDAGVNVPGDYHGWYAAAVYVETLHGHESTRSGAVVVADLRHVA
jgi:hypothetical protein